MPSVSRSVPESGKEGGFDEKLEAAKECGILAVVIRNPENVREDLKGESLDDVLEKISEKTGISLKNGRSDKKQRQRVHPDLYVVGRNLRHHGNKQHKKAACQHSKMLSDISDCQNKKENPWKE